MNCISRKEMQCWRMVNQLRSIFLVAVASGLMATTANAQCYQPPDVPCWFDDYTLVGAVSRSTDTLDIFAEDVRGYVYGAAWQPGTGWQGWYWLPGLESLIPTQVTAVSRSTDKIDLFTVDLNRHVKTAAWDSANGWHGWWSIGDLTVCSGPENGVTAVSRSTDKLDIFAVGDDGQVYTAARQPGFTGWHGRWPIPGVRAGPCTQVAAVSRITDALDIFVVDVNGTVQAAAWEPGFAGWTSWHQIPGVQAFPGSTVTAVKRNTNCVHLFLTDDKWRIQTAAVFPAFGGWNQIGFADTAATVSAISRRPGRLDVFVAAYNFVWTNGWEPDLPNWTGWQIIPNFAAVNGAPIGAVSRSLDKIDVYAVAAGYNVWTAGWQPAFGKTWDVFPLPMRIRGHP